MKRKKLFLLSQSKHTGFKHQQQHWDYLKYAKNLKKGKYLCSFTYTQKEWKRGRGGFLERVRGIKKTTTQI